MKKIKVAVIGVGHLGKSHAKIYSQLKNVDLVAVCDVNKKRAQTIAKLNNAEAVFDYKKLLSKVQAASIVVPTNLHYKIAKDFIRHKIHILIEKPITENLNQADKLLKESRKANIVLQVGHVERFNAAVKAVKKIIKEPKFIECHRLGPYNARVTDVGVVLDLMIHDIDIILHIVKADIKKIDAVGVNVLSKHEDIANARIVFSNDTICNITASRISQETVRKIRIFQKDTYVSLDYVKQEALIYRKQKNTIVKRSINIKKEESLKVEIQSFINCIINKQRPVVSANEAKLALKIALRIIKKIHNK